MIITAIFNGDKESLGYIPSWSYRLEVTENKGIITIEPVFKESGAKKCIYNSLVAFLSNWSEIKKV